MADEKSDDIVSLEDLLRDEPAKKQRAAASAETNSASTQPVEAPPDLSELNRLLEAEDPEFAAQLKDIGDLAGVEFDDADLQSVLEEQREEAATKGFKKVVLLVVKRPARRLADVYAQIKTFGAWFKKEGILAAVYGAKNGFAKLKEWIATAISIVTKRINWFRALPRLSKFKLFGVVLLGVFALAVAQITLTHGLFPKMDANYLTSFETVADARYEIEKGEVWHDLNDPLLHPEHVVLIERIIANLRQPDDGRNPMALIDLYVESATQEVAIELKNREGEARDVIGRTLNQMEYDELTTQAGKTKLKVFLRKNLNEVLTSGRVRRVYFKSIIVKP